MAPLLSDVAEFTNAFSQLAGSVAQLHQVRVQAEAEAQASQISKLNFDFVQRLNLPAGDPNKLSLDEGTPNYWRTAMEQHDAEIETGVGSIKDPSIRAGVETQLQASRQKFALDMSNALAGAELQRTQESMIVLFDNQIDTGDIAGAMTTWETIKTRQIFSPADQATFEQSRVVPIQARAIASAAIQATVVKSTKRTYEKQADESGEYSTEAVDTEVQSAQSINRAIDIASEADIGSKAVKDAAVSMLLAQQNANDDQSIAMGKAMVDAAQKEGYSAAEQINGLLSKYAGNISDGALASLLSYRFASDRIDTSAGISQYGAFVFASAGASFDPKTGAVVGGTKKIPAAVGFQYIQSMYAKFLPGASDNAKLTGELQEMESKIRSLMADPGTDSDAVFESGFNMEWTKLKAGQITPADLAGYLYSHASELSTDKYIKYMTTLEDTGYQSKEVTELMSQPAMRQRLAMWANDKMTTSGSAKDVVESFIKGEPAKNPRAQAMIASFMSQVNAEVTGSTALTPEGALAIFDRLAVKWIKDFDAGAFDPVRTGIAKDDVYKKVSQLIPLASGATPGTIYGTPVTSSTKAAIWEQAMPIAYEMIDKRGADKGMGPGDLFPVYGPDGSGYVMSKVEYDKTVYRVSGADGRVILTPMTVLATTDYGLIKDAIEKGDMRLFTDGPQFNSDIILPKKPVKTIGSGPLLTPDMAATGTTIKPVFEFTVPGLTTPKPTKPAEVKPVTKPVKGDPKP